MTVLPFTAARRLTRSRTRRTGLGVSGWAAVVVLVLVAAAAVLAPLIAPYDPNTGDLLHPYATPSADHWLGTDGTGRDVFSRLVYGARTSLLGPAAVVLAALLLGVPLALVSAWRGGRTRIVLGSVLDVMFAIPGLLLAILAVAMFGPGLGAAVIALAIAYLPYVARLATTAAEGERRLPYVQALSVQGHGALRVNVRHVLRNLSPVLVGQASVAFAYALIDLASLSFLGLAVQAPQADWGVLASDKDALLKGHPLGVASASVLIVVTVLSLFVLGSRVSGEDRR
ncbi:ABC transporter permease [Nocardioides mangrovi]|uniref:ABC transporter permease n=1 Tax=Nocardioides mangrovi TaxID=2874580 RepID=A0ABS7U7Z2_9ACTN|nr:ABC transporter permease [Nocardioides mangrovi]MBZ5737093.1 ABC transporter permease [Nocardioides mangrovi]